jgi:hypothetical protein
VIENQHLIHPTIFRSLKNVVAAMSTRLGGVSPHPYGMNSSYHVGDREEDVRTNRERFFSLVGATPNSVVQPRQVHSADIKDAASLNGNDACDGLLSNQAKRLLAISVADCVPILLASKSGNIVAAVHAGWRGSANKILSNAVNKMRIDFGAKPEDILAWIGPSASACCYEVGQEVAVRFASPEVRFDGARQYLNLKLANRNQLLDSGLDASNIEIHAGCTICESETFHSFRRDGSRSGRMLAVIGIH